MNKKSNKFHKAATMTLFNHLSTKSKLEHIHKICTGWTFSPETYSDLRFSAIDARYSAADNGADLVASPAEMTPLN